MFKRLVAHYKEAYSGLPREAWILALSEFINRCGFMVLVFLNIYLTKKLNLSLLQAGRILSAFGLGSIAGGYLGGQLCDKIGIRRVQLGSLWISGVILIAAGYVYTYPLLLAALFLYGLFSSAMFPANDTAMTRFCSGETRARGFAMRRLAANLGITFGPIIGGYLILIDYHWMFWVDGLTTLASAALLARLLKPDALKAPAKAADEASAAPVRSPLRDGTFLAFMGLLLIMMTVFSQLFSTFNLYLNSVYGLRENQIGPIWAVNTIMIVLIEMALLHALRKRSEMKIIAVGALFLGAGFALLPLGRTFGFAALTVAVWTMGEILTIPLSATVTAARAGTGPSAGRYMGVLSLVFSLSMLIAPMIGNWLYARIGGDALWLVMGGVSFLTALGIWSLRKRLAIPKTGSPPAA